MYFSNLTWSLFISACHSWNNKVNKYVQKYILSDVLSDFLLALSKNVKETRRLCNDRAPLH